MRTLFALTEFRKEINFFGGAYMSSLRVPLYMEEDEPERLMKHQQIVNQIADQVALGILREGERLDTIADVEASLELSHATVAKAYAVLQERGIIETARRKGSIIASIPKALRDELQRDWASRAFRPIARECLLARVTPDNVLNALEHILRHPGKSAIANIYTNGDARKPSRQLP